MQILFNEDGDGRVETAYLTAAGNVVENVETKRATFSLVVGFFGNLLFLIGGVIDFVNSSSIYVSSSRSFSICDNCISINL